MAKLKNIWLEHYPGERRGLRIDWDNDRHQRVEIKDNTPEAVAKALAEAASLVYAERAHDKV